MITPRLCANEHTNANVIFRRRDINDRRVDRIRQDARIYAHAHVSAVTEQTHRARVLHGSIWPRRSWRVTGLQFLPVGVFRRRMGSMEWMLQDRAGGFESTAEGCRRGLVVPTCKSNPRSAPYCARRR